jgi:hypothetical protein
MFPVSTRVPYILGNSLPLITGLNIAENINIEKSVFIAHFTVSLFDYISVIA